MNKFESVPRNDLASNPREAAEQSASYVLQLRHVDRGYSSKSGPYIQGTFEQAVARCRRNREWAAEFAVPECQGLVESLTTLKDRLLEIKSLGDEDEQYARWQDIMRENDTYQKTLLGHPYTDGQFEDVIDSIATSAYEQIENPLMRVGSNQVRFNAVIARVIKYNGTQDKSSLSINEIFRREITREKQLPYRGAEPFTLHLSDISEESLEMIARFRDKRDDLFRVLHQGQALDPELAAFLSSRIDTHIKVASDWLEKDAQKLAEYEVIAHLTDEDIDHQATVEASEAREAILQKARAHTALNLALLQDAARLTAEYEGVAVRLSSDD